MLVVINAGGLFVYRVAASPLLVSSFTFEVLMSWQARMIIMITVVIIMITVYAWSGLAVIVIVIVMMQSMNDMLIVNILYTPNGEVNKRREKLRFITKEAVHMRVQLTRYSETVRVVTFIMIAILITRDA